MISRNQLILVIIVIAVSIPAIPLIGHALTPTTTVTLDNANRREYVYCPLNSTNIATINPLASSELDGCPLVRIYINHWNTLPILNQTTIDTMLRSKGFTDAGENPTLK